MITTTTSVRTTMTASQDGSHTYEVKKELLNSTGKPVSGKDALLIGLYPAVTVKQPYTVDLSTTHLVAKMEPLGLRSVRIVNLFSAVCQGRLSARGLDVDEENLNHLETILKEETMKQAHIIIAWGSSMKGSRAANLSKARISNLLSIYGHKEKICQLTAEGLVLEHGDCVHVLYLGIRHKNDPWSLIPYTFPKDRLLAEDLLEQEAQSKHKGKKKEAESADKEKE